MKWIPNTFKPDRYDDYIVLDDLGIISIYSYNMCGWQGHNGNVLFWMELPEKPKDFKVFDFMGREMK
jgi:hypothetical protein